MLCPEHAVVIATDGNNRLWCKGKAFKPDFQCKSICQISIYGKTTIFPKQMLYPYLPLKTTLANPPPERIWINDYGGIT
jgi:hypothetical protein